jgi:type VI protein secretion system component VasF
MAEIKVERKKGIPVWALLLALIVLALLVWYFLSNRHHPVAPDNVTVLELSAPAPVYAFVPATRCA